MIYLLCLWDESIQRFEKLYEFVNGNGIPFSTITHWTCPYGSGLQNIKNTMRPVSAHQTSTTAGTVHSVRLSCTKWKNRYVFLLNFEV